MVVFCFSSRPVPQPNSAFSWPAGAATTNSRFLARCARSLRWSATSCRSLINSRHHDRRIAGSFLPRSALFFSPGQYQRSPLAEQLGCEFCGGSNCIQCGEDTATNIPGVYAGNASRGVQLVIAAAAERMQAAFAINSALLEADAARTRCAITSPANPRLRIALRDNRRAESLEPRHRRERFLSVERRDCLLCPRARRF